MSTYKSNLVTVDILSENKQSHQRNCIGHNKVDTNEKFHGYPESFHSNLVRLVKIFQKKHISG